MQCALTYFSWFSIYFFVVFSFGWLNHNKVSVIFFGKILVESHPLYVCLLSFCSEEVFQVEWDPNHEAVLASSADDRRLNIWDLNR